ncbi:hypothetical protein ACFLV1_01720 [Chloroflexota bacterium]
MNWPSALRLDRRDFLKLAPILLLAFFIVLIPKLSYPYPVHVDEWEHLVRAQAVLESGTSSIDPFTGELEPSVAGSLEAGFHYFLAAFHAVSGISWLDIFRFLPSVLFAITVFLVYLMARPQGYGWEAAFFTCLVTTTVGIMGSAFLVPVAMGLLFIPLIFLLAFNFKNIWGYLLVFLSFCFLLASHAPSAIIVLIVLTPYVVISFKNNFKHGLFLALALLFPLVITLPLTFDLIASTARGLLTPQYPREFVEIPQRLAESYGIIPVLLSILGCIALLAKGGEKNHGVAFGFIALELMLVIFFQFHYGIPLLYERGLLYIMLMAGITAGAGLNLILKIRIPPRYRRWFKAPRLNDNLGKFFSVALIAAVLAIAIPQRLETPYYHMIDETDYQAFVWIKNNLEERPGKALLDPWKATAFVAITDRYVYSRISAFPTSKDEQVYKFLEESCADTSFLTENRITIVYTRQPCANPDLIEVRQDVYLEN